MLADPYGQVEMRASTGGVTPIGTGALPAPSVLDAGAIGETSEGRLVRVIGTITASASRSTSNDLAFSITGGDGATLKVMADASAGIDPSILRKGVVATFTGVSGQRATHKGAHDGYRLWLRDRADVVITSQPSPSPSPTGKPTPTPKGGSTPKPSTGPSKPAAISIRSALLRDGQRVTVEGVLTIGTGLLDASGRRTIIEDATAAIELYLAAPDAAMRLGTRVRVTGTVGKAWGALRLRADETHVLGSRQPTVHALRTSPTAAVEWRLIKLEGTVADVHRNGDRWSAELQIAGGAKVPVSGLAGSGIPSTAMIEGRTASVVGIVKRPYPTATDRRFALVPRRTADVVLGKPVATPGAGTGTGASLTGGTGAGTTSATGAPIPGNSGSTTSATTPAVDDVDLRDIAAHLGHRVRVGGLVTVVGAGGVRLDDGTSGALLVLEGDATDLLTVLEPGDALNATGTPDQRDETVLVVADAADIELVGDLGADPGSTDGVGLAAAVVEGTPAATPEPAKSAEASTPATSPIAVGAVILALLIVTAATAPLLARRRRRRRALRARIATRLEALRRAPAAASGGHDQAMNAPIGAQSGPELGGNVPGTA